MSGAAKGKRVLIVDDEHLIANTLTTIFRNEGYEARSAYSAEQALAILSEEPWLPHLAIIDIRLPKMNGLDLAVILKRDYPECKLSLFSGQSATGGLIELAKHSGHSFDVLAKPIHPKALLGIADSLLHESS